MFAEKLNFLMGITKMQNNMLASAVNLDASHISRLRHGTRKLPKKQTYLMSMARCFARQIKYDYQKTLSRMLSVYTENGRRAPKSLQNFCTIGWRIPHLQALIT